MTSPDTFFRALADSTRRHCLLMLFDQDRLCVCELVHALDLSQPRVSRHLTQLRDLGIVTDERHGRWIHYRLHPDLSDWALAVLKAARAGEDLDPLSGRLECMPNRPEFAV